MQAKNIEQTVNEIFELYQKYGDEDYIGEPVSQVEHMCQAAQLAEAGKVTLKKAIWKETCDDAGIWCDELGRLPAVAHHLDEARAGRVFRNL